MKKSLLAVAVPAALLLAGCSAGPGKLHRSWDDYTNKAYAESPLLTGVLTDIVPIYPIVGWLAWIPDWLVLNPVQFWGTDVWDGNGVAFHHEEVKSDKKAWYDK